MIVQVKVRVGQANAALLLNVPAAVASAGPRLTVQDRVHKDVVNVALRLSAPEVEASAGPHLTVQDRDLRDAVNAVHPLNVQEAVVNAARHLTVQGRGRKAVENVALRLSAQVVAVSVAQPMIVPVVAENVAHLMNVPEAEVNAARLSIARVRDMNPSLSPYVKRIERSSKVIFINPEIPRWVVTDQTGALIVSLFDGSITLDEIVDIAVCGLGEDHRRKISDFCQGILNSGLLEHVVPESGRNKHRMALSSVHLSLSDNCNLNCTYCYARERVEKKHPRLTYEQYVAILDDIITINPDVTITLTGGEPLLNKDCLRIAEYIRSKGVRCLLLTNGILINESNVQKISFLFDLVTVSIDGPDAQVHAKTRGDNYDKVIKAVGLLEKHGVEHTVSMTVTKDNIAYVEQMARLFGSRLNYAPYFPVSGEPSQLAITGEEYYQALKQAAGVNPLSYCEGTLDSSLHSPCHKCAIGDGEFSISATGDVYPCQLLHTDEFYAGNVHEESIVDIYHNAPALQRCAALDVDTMEGCRDCPIKYICGGGCRARAFYECGRIDSSSDFCRYEQEAFYDGIIDIYSRNSLE